MILSKTIASCAGIGYIKGGGTVAAVAYVLVWIFVPVSILTLAAQLLLFLVLLLVGVLVSNRLEPVWGKDSGKIVIDEVAGMCCSLLLVPHQWQYALTGLVLFRFFDIVKPIYISSAEKLPGGWGVMADDVMAGVYSNLVLQLILVTNVF